MKRYFYILIFLILSGCGAKEEVIGETHLRVNSYTVDCVGVMEGQCLLVQEGDLVGSEDWEYFYFEDGIVGFDYEPGYIYNLLVKKVPVKNPPMDGSSIRYELIRILSKEKQVENN